MVLFFAFSSIIGNYFYGEMNMGFISKKPSALRIFRVLVVAMAFIGSVTQLSLVWNLADLFMALMALLNLAAIALIGRYAYRALADYLAQKNAGIKDPEFDPKCLGQVRGVQCWPRNKEEEIVQ